MPTPFVSLGVPAYLDAYLEAFGITEPTPIQAASLADLFAGRDACGGAPTGSGKTLAFGLPLVASLRQAKPYRPTALILTPTRELAGQILGVLEPLVELKGNSAVAIYGGVGFRPQTTALRRGVELVVACPGRLEDLLSQRALELGDVQSVVVDEADRMADMGFLPAVSRILEQTAKTRQTVLFSATLDGAVDKLARKHLTNPVRHTVAATVDDVARTTHLFWSTPADQRRDLCAALAHASGRTIIFTRTKRGADRVARQLSDAGVSAAAIHGDRSQSQREHALARFHSGDVEALVATDVAARGIHVDDVACVVHFDPPAAAADYLHRSGRTARAGASGVVATLVTEEVRGAVRQLQRELGMPTGTTQPDLSVLRNPADRPVRERVAVVPSDAAERSGTGRGERQFPRRSAPSAARPERSGTGRGDRPAAVRADGRPAAPRPPGRPGGFRGNAARSSGSGSTSDNSSRRSRP